MTRPPLEEDLLLVEKASPFPWFVGTDLQWLMRQHPNFETVYALKRAAVTNLDDLRYVAMAANHLPQYISYVQALEAENAALKQQSTQYLAEIERLKAELEKVNSVYRAAQENMRWMN